MLRHRKSDWGVRRRLKEEKPGLNMQWFKLSPYTIGKTLILLTINSLANLYIILDSIFTYMRICACSLRAHVSQFVTTSVCASTHLQFTKRFSLLINKKSLRRNGLVFAYVHNLHTRLIRRNEHAALTFQEAWT